MDLRVKINRHSFRSPPNRLEIVLSISKGSEMRKIGKIMRTNNQLLCVPNTPFGMHMSVHDADEKHPMARIHQRIPHGKGVFQIYPPGSVLGTTIGVVDIPPFAEIRGVLPLPPEQPSVRLGLGLVRAESLWEQSTLLSVKSMKQVINTDITSFDSLGMGYYFLESGDIAPFLGWINERQDMFVKFDLAVEVFEAFVPWLAIIVARGNFTT